MHDCTICGPNFVGCCPHKAPRELTPTLASLLKQKKSVEDAIESNRKNRSAAIGKNIKGFRSRDKLTQAELAALIGCERATITNIELGNQRASIDHIIELASIFNVSFDELLNC